MDGKWVLSASVLHGLSSFHFSIFPSLLVLARSLASREWYHHHRIPAIERHFLYGESDGYWFLSYGNWRITILCAVFFLFPLLTSIYRYLVGFLYHLLPSIRILPGGFSDAWFFLVCSICLLVWVSEGSSGPHLLPTLLYLRTQPEFAMRV